MNCRRWSENVNVTLPDSIPSNEVEFENMLSINVEVLRYMLSINVEVYVIN